MIPQRPRYGRLHLERTLEEWRRDKTGQKGTNTMFVMSHDEIKHASNAGKKITYANPVVDHCPQKEDPNQIQITAGGNLIQCDEELSVPMAGLETAKLH